MSDNSIAILEAAAAYRKQLHVRNALNEVKQTLQQHVKVNDSELREANDTLTALGENLHAQAGGYAPSTGQAKASSMAQTIAAAFNQDDVRPVRGN